MTDTLNDIEPPYREGEGKAFARKVNKLPATNDKVDFRLIQTPCCKTLLCWVNPRRPNFCPECGAYIWPQMRNDEGLLRQCEGWLRLPPGDITEAGLT